MNVSQAMEILGIEGQVTESLLRKAYRKSVKQWHPDMFYTLDEKRRAYPRFIEIQEAYDFLTGHKLEWNRHENLDEDIHGKAEEPEPEPQSSKPESSNNEDQSRRFKVSDLGGMGERMGGWGMWPILGLLQCSMVFALIPFLGEVLSVLIMIPVVYMAAPMLLTQMIRMDIHKKLETTVDWHLSRGGRGLLLLVNIATILPGLVISTIFNPEKHIIGTVLFSLAILPLGLYAMGEIFGFVIYEFRIMLKPITPFSSTVELNEEEEVMQGQVGLLSG